MFKLRLKETFLNWLSDVEECELYSLATLLDPRYKKELCVGVRKVQGHQKESC